MLHIGLLDHQYVDVFQCVLNPFRQSTGGFSINSFKLIVVHALWSQGTIEAGV